MIGRLSGILREKQLPQLLLEVQGVGYEVLVPLSLAMHLPAIGEPLVLHTHFVVREDAQLLYGFLAEYDRFLFRQLIKVTGIGPKTALAILSALDSEALVSCIVQGDVKTLSKTPGIGKKTAERLVMDLRDPLAGNKAAERGGGVEVGPGALLTSVRSAKQDAIDALLSLGYALSDVSKRVEALAKANPEDSSEQLIKAVLKHH